MSQLTIDLPKENFLRGQVETVVEFLAAGKAFEVEFSDCSGRIHRSLGLYPAQIMRLQFHPLSLDTSDNIAVA